MAEGKKSFTVYIDWIHMMESMTTEQVGESFQWILKYVNDRDPEMPSDPVVKIFLSHVKATLKRDLEKWLKRCETNRINAEKGGQANKKRIEAERSRTATDRTRNKPDKDKDKDKDIKKSVKKKFLPPTKEEVADYFEKNGYAREKGVEVWEYYDAGDWTDAKGNPVKNWKQKVRNWFKDLPKSQISGEEVARRRYEQEYIDKLR